MNFCFWTIDSVLGPYVLAPVASHVMEPSVYHTIQFLMYARLLLNIFTKWGKGYCFPFLKENSNNSVNLCSLVLNGWIYCWLYSTLKIFAYLFLFSVFTFYLLYNHLRFHFFFARILCSRTAAGVSEMSLQNFLKFFFFAFFFVVLCCMLFCYHFRQVPTPPSCTSSECEEYLLYWLMLGCL